jgi:PAS domain S-box-containing protein
MRGFLATGESGLASAWEADAVALAADSAALGRRLREARAEETAVARIAALAAASRRDAESAMARRRAGFAVAEEEWAPGLVRLRAELDQVTRRVDAQVGEQRTANRRRLGLVVAAIGTIGAGTLMVVWIIWRRSEAAFRRARAAEGDVAGAAADLERRIAERTAELAESHDLLRKREAQLRTVTNSANVGLVVVDAEHRLRYVNRAYALGVGKPAAEIVGRHVREVHGAHYETELRSGLERCLAGDVVAGETTLPAVGAGRPARSFSVVLTPDREGAGPVAVVVLADITEQREAERGLRESRRLYANLVEQLPAGIFRKDLAGRHTFVNPAFARMTDAAAPDLVGRTSGEFARLRRTARGNDCPDGWEASYVAADRHHAEIVETGRTLAQDEEMIMPGGERRNFHTIKSPVRDEAGTINGSQGILIEVTEARQAEAAWRAGEVRIRLATEAAAIGFWESDLRTGRITWSDREATLMGYAPGEFSGRPEDFVALIHPDDREKFRAARQRALEGADDYSVDLRFVRRDGTVRWGLVRGRVERDEAGAPVRFVGVEIDLTALKLAELEVREQRRTLALFVEHVPAAITMLDRDLRYLSASRRWARDFAADSPELIGRRHPELFAEFSEEWCRRYERALAGERVRVEAERWVRSAGERWIRWELHPWTDDRGDIGGIVILAEDISARRTAELALQTERTLLRTIFDVLPESIYVKDRDSRFLMANATCAADMGEPAAAALLGRTDADYFDPGLAPRFREAELGVLGGRDIRDRHDTFRREDGTVCHRINTVVPLCTPEGRVFGLLGTSRDVTAAKQAEQQIRELNARLEQRVLERTAQLEAANNELEAFSYSVSHDLRAPLRAIDGFSRIVEEDHAELLPAEGRRRLSTVRSEARRMGRLIDDLLAFSRLGRGPVEAGPVDMDALVRECLASLAPDCAGRKIVWEVEALPAARGNASLIRQIWANLIDNAVKYTRPRAQATIRISAATTAEGVAVYAVRDDGVGFDMRYAGRLFGVFQRLHRADEFEGTGAGLAIARRIVQRHFGRIWAESAPDQGATFSFTLFETTPHERPPTG